MQSLNFVIIPCPVDKICFIFFLSFQVIFLIEDVVYSCVQVCKRFNDVAGGLLTATFQRLLHQMQQEYHIIRAQMPRRESARRSHPLARKWDIYETLSMRLSLLQMTLGKHLDLNHIPFFPGEVGLATFLLFCKKINFFSVKKIFVVLCIFLFWVSIFFSLQMYC